MKLWIFSDLHLDYNATVDLTPPQGADVALIAGDVCDPNFLRDLATKIPVVFTTGNHEYYRSDFADTERIYRNIPNLHFLQNDAITIDGVTFAGATLWTDYRLYGDEHRSDAMFAARHAMNDHRRISRTKTPWERFLPMHAAVLHQQSVDFLRKNPSTVVLTHHAPTPASIAPRYQGQIMNAAYASDLTELIASLKPTLWVHGHVHSSFDYHVGETRVLANPHGYADENPSFSFNSILEV